MNILTVIPTHAGDCLRAEKLIDQLFALNRKEQKGHCLLVLAPSVPQENRDKLRISAEVAFKSVTLFTPELQRELKEKPEFIGAMLAKTSLFIAKTFRSPWLWLEPDCLPLCCGWLERIADAYNDQPMRYMGGHLKHGEAIALSRIAVYPPDTVRDLEAAAGMQIPFEFYAKDLSSKSRLFQTVNLSSSTDAHLIRPDAVLAHSDKAGIHIEKIVSNATREAEYAAPPIQIPITVTTEVTQKDQPATQAPKKRGRPPKVFTPEPATI